MNLHHLELFYYVARHRGIAPAVDRMPYGVQQPAVSMQLIQLEKTLGQSLFVRRPFSLTPSGEELYRSIAPFFDQLESLETRLKEEDLQPLRIAAPPTLLRDHLPELLELTRRAFPRLRLRLREATPTQALALLFAEKIDLALSFVPEKKSRDIQVRSLMRFPMVLLIPRRSPWNEAEEVFAEAREGKCTLISLPSSERIAQAFEEELESRGMSWEQGIEVHSLNLIQSYVLRGFGVGLSVAVPGQVLPRGLRELALPRFPLLDLGVFWRGELSPQARFFVNALGERVRKIATGQRTSRAIEKSDRRS